jgi:hypothetical protein
VQLDLATELDPLNAETHHNRGLVHERRGDAKAAIVQYRNALRYRPGYAPSVEALTRLSVPIDESAPQTPRRAARFSDGREGERSCAAW